MIMLDFSAASLKELAIHYIGNKSREEGVYLSKNVHTSFVEEVEKNFLQYFTGPFKNAEVFYNFYHPVDPSMNEVYSFAKEYFEERANLETLGEKLALTLYDKSGHPNISGGELFVTAFSGCAFNGQTTDAIGIYKSEVKETFIKVKQEGSFCQYNLDTGININKVDKACIILNTSNNEPYTICVLDNTNKSKEAKFWTDDFLKLVSCQDSFHFTKDYLDVAKKFVTEKMPEVYELSKADKIDYLNKSINYFKKNDHFAEEDFLQDVFRHGEVIDQFNQYRKQYTADHDMVLDDAFDISNQAVKKQAKVFKSILKLDKNFHIYIHGNKELIQKGTDADGRKYYKIYYEKEV